MSHQFQNDFLKNKLSSDQHPEIYINYCFYIFMISIFMIFKEMFHSLLLSRDMC